MIGLWFWHTNHGHVLFFLRGAMKNTRIVRTEYQKWKNGPHTYQIANGLNLEHFPSIGDTATESPTE